MAFLVYLLTIWLNSRQITSANCLGIMYKIIKKDDFYHLKEMFGKPSSYDLPA